MHSLDFKTSIAMLSNIILRGLLATGAGVLALMMFFTITDVIGRYLFNMPIDGGFELIEFMMAIFVPFALVYCEQSRSHITVDLFFERLPVFIQRLLSIITTLLTLIFFALISWQSYLAICEELANKISSSVLLLPTYPFIIPLLIAFSTLTLFFIFHFLKSLKMFSKR